MRRINEWFHSRKTNLVAKGLALMLATLQPQMLQAHELTLPKKNLDQYKTAYSLLIETVNELKTNKTGLTSAKVQELLRLLKGYEKRQLELIEMGKNQGVVMSFWVDNLKAMQNAKKMLQVLYSFEVDEEYLRANISNPNVFINAKGYVLKLEDELGGVQGWTTSVSSGMQKIWDGLLAEMRADVKKITAAVEANGTDAQKRKWREFIYLKPNLC
ncbi:MAG: hypothetical protein QF811_04925 [Candidatus Woesearchaeota archaeon]|jgi:hypothetical protein|nr:hypothetical protein [Candidatus Woesearchaeota archaeon]